MTGLTGCQHVRRLLGVYVLGAIDPAERADVDAHLVTCHECREELAGLAGLPALLGRVPASEAARIAGFDEHERLAPGPDGDIPQAGEGAGLLAPLLGRMAQRRRVQRWRNLAAAAAVVIVAAGSAIGVVSTNGSAPASQVAGGHWENVAAANTSTRARADVRYAGTPSGIKLDIHVSGIPAGTTCEFWVLGANGKQWPASSWIVPKGRQSPWYQTTSAAPISGVRDFQVTSGGTVLLAAKA